MLRLKEKPLEWIKFTAVIGLVLNGVSHLLWRNKLISEKMCWVTVGLTLAVIATAMIRPHWFRSFYRGGMTFSFHIGQVIGKVNLILFFLIIVTPMGLLLRLMGKDLLQLKRTPEKTTYWQKAKNQRNFDQMF
jgi:uncharacterized membrane protein